MAYDLIATIERYSGLSTDTKPTPGFVGSEFYEHDTGRNYIYVQGSWRIKPVPILNIQGGAYTVQDLMEEFHAMLDLARSPQSGTYTHADADEETYYEESDTHSFCYYGSYLDFTGAAAGAGENTTVKLYVKVKSGGTYRLIWESAAFLAAAVPDPICRLVPNDGDAHNNETVQLPLYNIYGVKLTATQAAVGGGWNSIDHEHFDSKRGG